MMCNDTEALETTFQKTIFGTQGRGADQRDYSKFDSDGAQFAEVQMEIMSLRAFGF